MLCGVTIRKDGKIIQGRNVMCRRCGLVYVWPRMTQAELDAFYRDEYRNVYTTSMSQRTHKAHSHNAYSIIKDLSGKHLDIGCSTGGLLELTGGTGLEPNTEHYEIAKASGLNVINCTVEDYEGDTFDVITLLNTLEHVIDPCAVLAKVRLLLSDNGVLLVTVPFLLSSFITLPVDAFLSNAHLYNFTVNTLSMMMAKVGLRPEEIFLIPEKMGEKLYVLARKTEPVVIDFGGIERREIELVKAYLENVDQLSALKNHLMGSTI